MKLIELDKVFKDCESKIRRIVKEWLLEIDFEDYPAVNNSGREKEMGMVYQSDYMQAETEKMLEEAKLNLKKAGACVILSTEINATTDLSLCVLPLKFDIELGGKTVLSLDKIENAYLIYNVLRADFKGEIYNG